VSAESGAERGAPQVPAGLRQGAGGPQAEAGRGDGRAARGARQGEGEGECGGGRGQDVGRGESCFRIKEFVIWQTTRPLFFCLSRNRSINVEYDKII